MDSSLGLLIRTTRPDFRAKQPDQWDLVRVLGSLGLASGAFVNGGLWWISPVALTPWFVVLEKSRPTRRVATGLAIGVGVGVSSAFWLPHALTELGSGTASSMGGLLAIAIWIKGMPYALFALLWPVGRRLPLSMRCIGIGAGWGAIEWIASLPEVGVGWALVGHSQIAALGVAQLASIVGVAGVSGAIVSCNAAVAMALLGRSRGQALRIVSAWLAAYVGLLISGLQVAKWVRPELEGPHQETTVLAVQLAIPRGERWSPGLQKLNVRRALYYTEQAASQLSRNPDLIVWPETTITTPIRFGSEIAAELLTVATELGVPVLLGIATPAQQSGESSYRSSVVVAQPGGVLVHIRDKHRGIPIFEASRDFPGASLLSTSFGEAARWPKLEESAAGPEAQENAMQFEVLLCYEALFREEAASHRPANAIGILVLSDETWAASTRVSRQILDYTRFRAIEQRLTLVRIAHGGLTAVVSPFGEIVEVLPADGWSSAVATLTGSPPPSLLEKISILLPPATAGLVVWMGMGFILRASSAKEDER